MNLSFVINSILLGVGLAMDAFSVSIANGLIEPCMRRTRMFVIAGTYSFFQFAMPMLGWFFVRTAAQRFEVFQKALLVGESLRSLLGRFLHRSDDGGFDSGIGRTCGADHREGGTAEHKQMFLHKRVLSVFGIVFQ